MYRVTFSRAFERDIKKISKQQKDMSRLKKAVLLLEKNEPLPRSLRDHLLTGNWRGRREFHLAPDWLVIYSIDHAQQVVVLERTGSHSELFS